MPVIKQKICFVLTVEYPVKVFLLDHLRALSKLYYITVIVNTNNPKFLTENRVDAKLIPLNIRRDISLFSDFSCLIKLIKIFQKENFSAVHSLMPKAGLLAMLAAWYARVPFRVHTFVGQVWFTRTGFKRILLKYLDILIGHIVTLAIIDSPSQLKFLQAEKVIKPAKAVVFAKGSISGVDIERFKSNPKTRAKIRKQLAIPQDAIVFLFLARLIRDKGVLDLASAWRDMPDKAAHLLIVGPDEQYLLKDIKLILGNKVLSVHFVGYTDSPESYVAASDVFCMPSYREGFGSILIQAAAAGIPAIASRIYGITDAVVDGETGLLHAPGDIDTIKQFMQILIDSKPLRLKLGEQAMARAIKDFDSKDITREWVKFYLQNVPQ
jgi:glycosyltransferase involved in cell wall biosynthesis